MFCCSPTLISSSPWPWHIFFLRKMNASSGKIHICIQRRGKDTKPKSRTSRSWGQNAPKLTIEKWSSMQHYGYSECDWVSKLLCPLSLIYLPSMVIIYSSNFGIKVFSANKFDDHDDNEDDKVWRWRWSERRGKECLCCIGIGRKSFGAPGEPAPLPQWAR